MLAAGGGLFAGLGTSLGFANPALAGVAGPTLSGLPLESGTLFGATTLGQFAGGVGLGFGAGNLLNSVLGGNATQGMIGSGVGALGGALAGTFLFPGVGTILGGLLGGTAGGGLGGIFGPSKTLSPSGAPLDLRLGGIGDFMGCAA